MPETINMDALAGAVLKQLLAQTQKAVSSTPDAAYGHGPTGLFSAPGVDPNIYNAMTLPLDGLEAVLPAYPTNYTTPVYNIMTGVTASSGSEPSTACADWPEAGLMKLCGYQTTLDRKGRSSRVFDISRVGQVINRSDMRDYTMVGDPFSGSGLADSQLPSGLKGTDALNNEYAKAMFEVKSAFMRDFAPDVYTGNPANNSGEGRKYYKGLDLLVNVGYADYETTTACPAADPILLDWTSLDVGLAPNGGNFVLTFVDIFRRLKWIARGTNMNPVTWVVVMPPSLFNMLAQVWPCAYYTNRCQLPAGAGMYVDVKDQIDMRDGMLNGSYLWVDGQKIQVIQDFSTTQTAGTGPNAGSFTSSVYILPLKVRGNLASLYKEFFNFNAPGAAMDFVKNFASNGSLVNYFNTSDNGRYLWLFSPPTNYCVQIQGMSRETLALRTPYLSARIYNVKWTPIAMERSPFPGAATYVNGGKTARS